jgi:hypothetical protein
LDVIKTRIQNRNFENPEGGFKIVASMMKNEGITSFFKGLVPKVCDLSRKLRLYTDVYLAPHDWTETGLLFLACADPDTGV